jgi:hypothetical protein
MAERFAQEIRTYEDQLEALLKTAHRQWVAVLGGRILGPHPTAIGAWKDGIAKFGDAHFMLRRILTPDEEIVVVSHVSLDVPTEP